MARVLPKLIDAVDWMLMGVAAIMAGIESGWRRR
jgi:hypothetical protein